MQDHVMQDQAQPFVKLVQANLDLIARFSTSPELTSQAAAEANRFLQQASESALKFTQSGAFMHLVQGMLTNYTAFVTELGRNGMAMMNQGQAVLARQVQDVAREAIDATDVRTRPARPARPAQPAA